MSDKVAIKVRKPELAAVLGAERFVQEIASTAQLQHPRCRTPRRPHRTGWWWSTGSRSSKQSCINERRPRSLGRRPFGTRLVAGSAMIEEHLRASLADHYRLERELGQGGMATVYLAQDLKHNRQVAIKVLKPELAAVLGAERFVQEILSDR